MAAGAITPAQGKADATATIRESEGLRAQAFLPLNFDRSRETVKQLGQCWLGANESQKAEQAGYPARSQAWVDCGAAPAKLVGAPGGP